MNIRLIIKVLGIFLLFLSCTMIVPMVWAFYFCEPHEAFLIPIAITACVGAAMYFVCRSASGTLYSKEGFAIVGLGWILSACFGCLPYLFSGTFSSFADAYFETMSGYTTTGASVLTDIEATAKSVLFWRSFTHWFGGMGIIVLFVAVFPFLGVGGKYLLQSEVPGPVADNLKPRVKETARILWFIYIGMTVIETIMLMFGGMSFFEGLCHSFGTVATGGFSTRGASIGAYNSAYIEWVITAFMIMAGTNFSIYYYLLMKRWKFATGNVELRTYIMIFLCAVVIIMLAMTYITPAGAEPCGIRTVAFQVASILTTTGYVTANYDLWPEMTKFLLVLLMFIGGCAGSTGGGIKVVRLIILFKLMIREIVKTAHPGAIRTMKIGGSKVEEDVITGVMGFFLLAMMVFAASTFLIAMQEIDLVTAATAVSATLWNIGPGLEKVGAIENYAFMTPAAKLLLAHCMLFGRLELFTIAVLFVPSIWRR